MDKKEEVGTDNTGASQQQEVTQLYDRDTDGITRRRPSASAQPEVTVADDSLRKKIYDALLSQIITNTGFWHELENQRDTNDLLRNFAVDQGVGTEETDQSNSSPAKLRELYVKLQEVNSKIGALLGVVDRDSGVWTRSSISSTRDSRQQQDLLSVQEELQNSRPISELMVEMQGAATQTSRRGRSRTNEMRGLPETPDVGALEINDQAEVSKPRLPVCETTIIASPNDATDQCESRVDCASGGVRTSQPEEVYETSDDEIVEDFKNPVENLDQSPDDTPPEDN